MTSGREKARCLSEPTMCGFTAAGGGEGGGGGGGGGPVGAGMPCTPGVSKRTPLTPGGLTSCASFAASGGGGNTISRGSPTRPVTVVVVGVDGADAAGSSASN